MKTKTYLKFAYLNKDFEVEWLYVDKIIKKYGKKRALQLLVSHLEGMMKSTYAVLWALNKYYNIESDEFKGKK